MNSSSPEPQAGTTALSRNDAAERQDSLRARIRNVLDDGSTGLGKVVAWTIMGLILASCVAVAVETVPSLPRWSRTWLRWFECFAVAVFSIEYVLRVATAERPLRRATEPLVLIDLAAILPFYISLFTVGIVDLRILRLLRTLRIMRLLKLHRYTRALSMLGAVVRDARHQLIAFLLVAVMAIVLMGSVMYHLEPETFESIPHAVWWSVVTLTTVGYGETVPQGPAARLVTGVLMLIGIGIIAVPAGIVSSGMVEYYKRDQESRACSACGISGHAGDASFCRGCGSRLGGPR